MLLIQITNHIKLILDAVALDRLPPRLDCWDCWPALVGNGTPGRELLWAVEGLDGAGMLGALLDELGIGMLALDWLLWLMELWQAISNNPVKPIKASLYNFIDSLIVRYQSLWSQTTINTIFYELEQKNRRRAV